MDGSYISAISALAGSTLGGLASMATTWVTQQAQGRAQRQLEAIAHRQRLYEEFIEEASKLFADVFTHDFEDRAKIVHLYAPVGKLLLVATRGVTAEADKLMGSIVETYYGPSPNRDFRKREDRRKEDLEVPRVRIPV